jgi:hypothetical protein
MGFLRDLTGSVEGLLLLLIIFSIVGVAILWLIFGALLFAALAVIFWETLLPGLLVFLGFIAMAWKGVKEGETNWLLLGFALIAIGFFMAAAVRWI